MDYKLLKDRLLVKRKDPITQSAGGIALLDIGQDLSDQGEVMAVGPGRITKANVQIAIDVKVGDKVMFAKGAGINVKLQGADFVVLREEELFAVLEQ